MTFDLNDFYVIYVFYVTLYVFHVILSQDASNMMNALQINQNVEEESALKVCAEDGEEDNFIFTQSYVLIQKPATMMVIALKKNPYVEIEIAEVCYVIYQSWGEG